MNKRYLYILLKENNDDLLFYISKMVDHKKLDEIKPSFFRYELDEFTEYQEEIKNLSSDFFIDVLTFEDKIGLDAEYQDVIYNYLSKKNTGFFNISTILEEIILNNSSKLKNMFKKTFESKISKEMIDTGLMFCIKGNSISASKELYIHRNTLIYRLDAIEKSTSLNLKNFKDQFVFYGLFH